MKKYDKVRDVIGDYIYHNPSKFGHWKWDEWDYELSSPVSMDDLAVVDVILINQDDTNYTINFVWVEEKELETLRQKVRDMK